MHVRFLTIHTKYREALQHKGCKLCGLIVKNFRTLYIFHKSAPIIAVRFFYKVAEGSLRTKVYIVSKKCILILCYASCH